MIVKLMVIGYIMSANGFFLGEKNLSAQEEASTTQDTNAAGGDLKANKEDPAKSKKDDIIVTRRSYIEDLLELPKIDKSGLEKNELSRFLMLLDRKIEQVSGRAKILEKRENHLKSLENSIDTKLQKLQEEATFFTETLQKEKDIHKERLDRLVNFYEKMTPKKAAPIFEQMDKDLVVALFKRIPKKQTMNILALMPPDKSVELSEYFGRIRSGKEYEMLQQINDSLKREFQECKGLPKEAD